MESKPTPADIEGLRDYLAGRLTDADAELVEAQILAGPELAREFETMAAMRTGLEELRRSRELQPLLAGSSNLKFWQRPAFALAASGLLVVSMLSTGALLRDARTGAAAPAGRALLLLAPMPAQETLRLEGTAGTAGLPDLVWRASGASRPLLLQADVGRWPAASYAVTLTRLDPRGRRVEVLRLPSLVPDAHKKLTLAVHSGLLQPGDYELSLSANNAEPTSMTPAESSYLLRIVP